MLVRLYLLVCTNELFVSMLGRRIDLRDLETRLEIGFLQAGRLPHPEIILLHPCCEPATAPMITSPAIRLKIKYFIVLRGIRR